MFIKTCCNILIMVEPIEITAYKCPICGDIDTNYERSKVNANLPKERNLPLGFIFKDMFSSNEYQVIMQVEFNSNHGVNHTAINAVRNEDRGYCISGVPNFSELKTRLEDKHTFLLGSLEYNNFIETHPNFLKGLKESKGIEDLVRVPEGLEEFDVDKILC